MENIILAGFIVALKWIRHIIFLMNYNIQWTAQITASKQAVLLQYLKRRNFPLDGVVYSIVTVVVVVVRSVGELKIRLKKQGKQQQEKDSSRFPYCL